MRERYERICSDWKHYGRGILPLGAYIFLVGGIFRLPICPMVYITGFPCPACGITRAAMLFLKGEFGASFRMHPLFYGVLILAVLAVLLRYILLKDITWMKYAVTILAAAAIFYYIYRMYVYFPDQEPMIYENRSLWGVLSEKIKALQLFQKYGKING